ncbi:MAG: hypothetical protein LBH09_06935 [Peptococcaceae bacterium]|nr:hypothetical protein [Peptococcaceae bacterium]
MSIFTVEIMRPGEFGINTSTTLEMPATWAEYQDAKEKARINDGSVIYSYELLDCKYDWLRPYIPENADLLELNLLAERMEHHIKDELDIFEAMVTIEAKRSEWMHIPFPRLINLTFSIENCHIADNIASDTQLGKFLFDNDFLTDGDAAAVQARIDSGKSVAGLMALLGKEHKDNMGGLLTGSGFYIEFDGSINEVYIPGEMVYFNRSGAPVVLEISKGFFDEPEYDNDLTTILNMPPYTQKALNNALEKVEASSLKECGYHCVDCLIPAAKEWINDAQDLDQAYNFAIILDRLERHGGVMKYKALLEAVECGDLETALRLTEDIEAYQLVTECYGPEDYAREVLNKSEPVEEWPIDISPYVDHYRFGKTLMERNNIINTSYGMLSRKDGGPVLSQADQPNMGMEMR